MTVLQRRLAAFASNADGNIAVMGAIAAVPIMIGIAGMATYANSVSIKQQTQAAADAAALAGTTAYINRDLDSVSAEGIAQSAFLMNAPDSAVSGKTSLTADVTVSADKVSTVVNYCGNQPSLFSAFVGSSMAVCTSATSTAALATSHGLSGSLYGLGTVWGDPHVIGAHSGGELACSDGNWMNIFSDYQFQINAQCKTWSAGVALTDNVLGDVAIVAGSHHIYISSEYSPAAGWASKFKGVVTVDGNTVTPPTPGSYPLVSDSDQGVKATDEYWYPNADPVTQGAGARGANYVEVRTDKFELIVSYNAYATIELSAKRAGACGAPSGALGQTYTPSVTPDWNGAHFETPGNDPWHLATNFSATCALKTVVSSQGRAVISK